VFLWFQRPIVPLGVAILAATAAEGCGRPETNSTVAAAETANTSDPRVQRADADRIKGDSAARVWLIVVSDFQCPWCKRWHDETAPRVLQEYVESGKVRMAYVHYPLDMHPHAVPAAEASMCAAAQEKFWPFHDSLFATQEEWAALRNAAPVFERIAASIGLDTAAWSQCLRDDVMLGMIQADIDRGKQAGARSTPTFFVDQRMIAGAAPFPSFKVALDSALAEAERGGR
jgi:protein-disulfide isomerase